MLGGHTDNGIGGCFIGYQPLFSALHLRVVAVAYVLNRQLTSTNSKCRATAVQLSVTIAGRCFTDSFTKAFGVAVCNIQLLTDRLCN